MVATDLRERLSRAGEEVVAPARGELDIRDDAAVREAVGSARPDVLVNCAAFTRVDDCEANEAEATAINGAAVGLLAAAATRSGSLLVQLSTDFVFDGGSRAPYEIDAPTAPISAYGRSKLVGEERAAEAERHVILRTSWLFGTHGWNFVEAIRKQVVDLGKKELRVVDDQRGCPTYTPHLAEAIERIAREAVAAESARGILHYADMPECTWFDFAEAIVDRLRERGEIEGDVRVLPVTSEEFPRPARRPAYSVLSTRRYEEVTGAGVASWVEGLAEYFFSRGRR